MIVGAAISRPWADTILPYILPAYFVLVVFFAADFFAVVVFLAAGFFAFSGFFLSIIIELPSASTSIVYAISLYGCFLQLIF